MSNAPVSLPSKATSTSATAATFSGYVMYKGSACATAVAVHMFKGNEAAPTISATTAAATAAATGSSSSKNSSNTASCIHISNIEKSTCSKFANGATTTFYTREFCAENKAMAGRLLNGASYVEVTTRTRCAPGVVYVAVALYPQNVCQEMPNPSGANDTAVYVVYAINGSDGSYFQALYTDSHCLDYLSASQIAPPPSSTSAATIPASTESVHSSSLFSRASASAAVSDVAITADNSVSNKTCDTTTTATRGNIYGAMVSIRYTGQDCSTPTALSYMLSTDSTCVNTDTCTYLNSTQAYIATSCITASDSLNENILQSQYLTNYLDTFNQSSYAVLRRYYNDDCSTVGDIDVVFLDACTQQKNTEMNGTIELSKMVSLVTIDEAGGRNTSLQLKRYKDSSCVELSTIVDYGFPDGSCRALYRNSVKLLETINDNSTTTVGTEGDGVAGYGKWEIVGGVFSGLVLVGLVSGMAMAVVRKRIDWMREEELKSRRRCSEGSRFVSDLDELLTAVGSRRGSGVELELNGGDSQQQVPVETAGTLDAKFRLPRESE
ncbi:hypothetical protein HDU82_003407 [Entophlyctis luteolus]|nr:hypothetical protein HDU82_003407 [Entophlyctis luteolus]